MGSNFDDEQTDHSQDEAGENSPALSTTRLVEGVRDTLLTWYKQASQLKPWPQMSETDQRMWLSRIEDRAEKLVREVVDRVATGDFPVVHAKIDSFQIKGGEVKITAKGFADDDVLITLNHAGPKAVKIIVADGEQFDEGRDKLSPDPDEPGLPGVRAGFEDEETPDPKVEEPEVEEPETEDPEQSEGEEVLKPKSAEWRGGFNSRMGGHARSENPFSASAQAEAFTDWFAGWDAANEDPKAKLIKGEAQGEVDRTAEQQAEGEPSKHFTEGQEAHAAGGQLDANPYVRKPMKEDWEKGWLAAAQAARGGPAREPDIEPEDTLPIPDRKPEDDASDDAITDQNGDPIETDDDAFAYGAWCRADGRGTGSNPFTATSDMGKAWLRGYSDQKAKERKTDDF